MPPITDKGISDLLGKTQEAVGKIEGVGGNLQIIENIIKGIENIGNTLLKLKEKAQGNQPSQQTASTPNTNPPKANINPPPITNVPPSGIAVVNDKKLEVILLQKADQVNIVPAKVQNMKIIEAVQELKTNEGSRKTIMQLIKQMIIEVVEVK